MSDKPWLKGALASLITTSVCLAIYHWSTARTQTPMLAVVDVAEIYRLKESEFSMVIMKPGTTEAERRDAIDRARAFGGALSAITEKLPAECGCIVLNKAAVIGSSHDLRDLTPEIKRRLGM